MNPILALPHSLEAERAVLGAILLEAESLPKAVEVLAPEHFYHSGHRKMFSAMVSLFERGVPVDALTLGEELRRCGDLDQVGGHLAIAQMVEEAATAAHLQAYAEIVKEYSRKRALEKLGHRLVLNARNEAGVAEIIERAEAELHELKSAGIRKTLGVDLVNFINAPPDPAEPLFKDLPLFLGLVGWIVALMKVGKSLFGLALLLALATGGIFLGRFKATRAFRVLYVQEEDGRRRVYHRIRRLLLGEGLVLPEAGQFRLLVRTGLRLDDAEAWSAFLAEVRAFRPEVVIFDVFDQLHDQDEDRRELLRPILRRLRHLAEEFDAAVLVLDHFRKTGAVGKDLASPGAKQRGSGAKWGWSEQSLYLEPQGEGAFVVAIETKDAPAPEPFLVRIVDTDNGGLCLVYEGPAAAKVSKAERGRRKVFDALEEAPRSVPVLAERTGSSEKTCRRHLETLRRDGLADAFRDPDDPRGQRVLWFKRPEQGELGDDG